MAMKMDKLEFKEAVKMTRHGFYMMHIRWLRLHDQKMIDDNPDCSHFLAKAGTNWRDMKNRAYLVLANPDAEPEQETDDETEKTMTDLYIENQLLRKAIRVYIHESASPISYYRNMIPTISFWMDKFLECPSDETRGKLERRCAEFERNLDTLCEFRRLMFDLVDLRNIPDSDGIRDIIAKLEKVLELQNISE